MSELKEEHFEVIDANKARQHNKKNYRPLSHDLFIEESLIDGQGLFASRFIYQWLYSEKNKQSLIPIGFWYLSIFGGLGLLAYAIFRKDPVIITGQIFGIFIYTRNLVLIYKKS